MMIMALSSPGAQRKLCTTSSALLVISWANLKAVSSPVGGLGDGKRGKIHQQNTGGFGIFWILSTIKS
jgi:hypothetical protein